METGVNGDNIKVLGAKPQVEQPVVTPQEPTAPIVKEQTPEIQEPVKETDAIENKGLEPNETQKEEVKESEETTKLEKKEEAPQNDSKSKSGQPSDKEDKQNAFAVSFGDEQPKEEKPNVSTEKQQETASVSAKSVLQYLKTEYPDTFSEVNSLTQLSKKEELSEPVQAFQKFHKETGRGIKDFYNLQKDWKEESQDATIKEYYKLTADGLSNEDIDNQMKLITVTDDHEMNLSDEELTRRKLEFKKEYNKAIKYMDAKSKEYNTPLENVANARQAPPTEQEIAKQYEPLWNATSKSLKEMDNFKFSIGFGDVNIPIDENAKKLIAERMHTDQAFFQPWMNEGKFDTNKAVSDILWTIPSVRQQLLTETAKQVHSLTLENDSKKKRNVNLDKIPSKEKEPRKQGVVKFGESKNTGMGSPIFNPKRN